MRKVCWCKEIGRWIVRSDKEGYLGDIQKTSKGWQVSVKGKVRYWDNFQDARWCAYNL